MGSDVVNSESMNSFLNKADITETGIVSEETLRSVYDAYSHTCARMLTERWATPTAIMNAQLYIWHILNDRHRFLRRIVLGYEKVRMGEPWLREGDMDEVFDEDYHTTGFSRPLRNACNAWETCDQVLDIIQGHQRREMLMLLWRCLVTDLLCYAKKGIADDKEEDKLCRSLEVMAQCWHESLVWELDWILYHASLHPCLAGQLLNGGCHVGELSRRWFPSRQVARTGSTVNLGVHPHSLGKDIRRRTVAQDNIAAEEMTLENAASLYGCT